jgi:hypothetical protein
MGLALNSQQFLKWFGVERSKELARKFGSFISRMMAAQAGKYLHQQNVLGSCSL